MIPLSQPVGPEYDGLVAACQNDPAAAMILVDWLEQQRTPLGDVLLQSPLRNENARI